MCIIDIFWAADFKSNLLCEKLAGFCRQIEQNGEGGIATEAFSQIAGDYYKKESNKPWCLNANGFPTT